MSTQVWVAGITAIALIAVAYIINTNAPSTATAIQDAILFASAVVGFVVTIYGGTKALLGLNNSAISASEVGVASATAAAGAFLLLASRF